jgi:hypothetical protein
VIGEKPQKFISTRTGAELGTDVKVTCFAENLGYLRMGMSTPRNLVMSSVLWIVVRPLLGGIGKNL